MSPIHSESFFAFGKVSSARRATCAKELLLILNSLVRPTKRNLQICDMGFENVTFCVARDRVVTIFLFFFQGGNDMKDGEFDSSCFESLVGVRVKDSQLVLQAVATSMIDAAIPEIGILFRFLDSSGHGTPRPVQVSDCIV